MRIAVHGYPPNVCPTTVSYLSYQEEIGIFSIEPVELIAGSLPKRQKRLVEAWAELHQQELTADWNTLQEGRTPEPIDPLK